MPAQSGTRRDASRKPRLLPVLLAALVLFPLDPFTVRAAAQAVSAEAAAAVSGSGAASAAAASVSASPVSVPTALTPVPSAFSAPLAPSAMSAAPTAASLPAASAAAPSVAAAALPAPLPAASIRTAAPASAALRRAPALAAPAAPAEGPAAKTPEAGTPAAPAPAASAAGPSAPADATADLAKLFDGAREFSADTARVALTRADGETVSVRLDELESRLRADPALARSATARLTLKGRGSPKAGVPADLEKALSVWLKDRGIEAAPTFERKRRAWVSVDLQLLKDAPRLLRESWTVPNRQDYAYLATKTFGVNLAVRAYFAYTAVQSGNLPLLRALVSTAWYQLQDAGFTVFGQTYMKFIGRMTGLLRVGRSYLGDFLFTYLQLTSFEFLNRLVLGPIGENPLVYTWHGLGLIFANIFMGMVSGGPLIPAISKMRRAGVISEKTMMHLYQLASLTMQFGLLASFGYQHLYFLLTTATLVLSWGSYAFFTLFYKDKPGIKTGMGGGKK